MTLQRVPLFVTLMVASGGFTFILGTLSTRAGNYTLYLSTLLTGIAVFVGTALRLVLSKERRAVAEIALGALLFSALLVVFVLGVFTPYLGGWGDRELQQFGGNDSTWLSFLLIAAGVSGVFFGAFVGFLSWASRSIRFQRN